MLETLTNCPICDESEFTPVREVIDHLVSQEQFTIVKCNHCSLQFTNPRPNQKSIIKYYKSDSYVSHSNKSNNIINLIYRLVRNVTLRQKLKLLNRHSLSGSLLDYGCGTGHFLSIAQTNRWSITGIEPDEDARAAAKDLLGSSQVFPSLDSTPELHKFNAITMFHVLEHVHELNLTLTNLVNLLKPDGVMIVAVPNYRSHDAQKYESLWAAYDVPRHLYHFDSSTIAKLANKVGLKVVSQLPMRFDSFYVSLLSEKNMRRSMPFIRGLLSGLVSNLKARQTKDYSSLIYILQKK